MGGVLYRSTPFEDGSEFLMGLATCDAVRDKRQTPPKVYAATLPRDAFFKLVAHGLAVALAVTLLFALPLVFDRQPVPGEMRESRAPRTWLLDVVTTSCVALVLWLVALLLQIPRRVVREPDALVFEFLLYKQVVPLDDVLELVLLSSGLQFRKLLRRWEVFPHGWTFRFFCGARSREAAVCVLLTRRCLWSFVFSLEDPVQFLLDNQRPLDLEASYKTLNKVVLRAGESLDSERVASVPRGQYLKVEEQRGSRVFVHFEGDGDLRGWMSYVTAKGATLLAKAGQSDELLPGTVGASELARGDASLLELGACPSTRGKWLE